MGLPFVKIVIKIYTVKMNNKKEFLDLVKSNIDNYGYHITLVSGGTEPRYAYTIGLTEKIGFELLFAGGIFYLKDEVYTIFNAIVEALDDGINLEESHIEIDNLGVFSHSKVHNSWSEVMMLGVFDFYNTKHITTFQVKPDAKHYTLDIPNMAEKWSPIKEPIWQWLCEDWKLPIPQNATAITNLDALMGKLTTEVMRWEDDEWEIFAGAGPDVQKKDIRVVPIGVLLGIDKSLHDITSLEIGKGVWRDSKEQVWNKWG